jgi:peptide-methionine (S)-S-oxide reductase
MIIFIKNHPGLFRIVITGAMVAGLFLFTAGGTGESVMIEREPENLEIENPEKATFGAGCFWGVEKTFQETDGVVEAISGYAGGETEDPSYKEVCSGTTGHAEVVQVLYDPERVSYDELLQKYWSLGVPSWGPSQEDSKNQYRHIILYHNEKQRQKAETSIKELEKQEGRKLAVYLEPLDTFYPAERYHQNYFMK